MPDISTPRPGSGVNVGMPGGEWDPDDAELGALLFVAHHALVSASVKAQSMSRHGRGALKARQLQKAHGALDRIKDELDKAWVVTRRTGESGPTPFYPTRERLPEEARTALEALDMLGRVRDRRAE